MDLYNLIISAKLSKGEGGDVSVDPLSVTENGTYTASSGHAYSPVTVSVPTGVFPSGTSQITSNGMYDVTNFASASVNVPGIVPSGTSSITANGIYDITNFASVDVNVSGGGGGDHDVEDGIIQRTISGAYTNSRVTTIGSSVFYLCKSLTAVNFSNVTTIGVTAFYSCSSLAAVSFPNATTIGSSAFQKCTKLATANFPNVTTIGSSAFMYCTSLTAASFPNATTIGEAAFYSCSSLTAVSFPNATTIGSSAFGYCIKLTTVSFPNVTWLGSSVFRNCTSLTELNLLASSVAILGNTAAFGSTPMSTSSYTGSFGSIYVPASLVSDYKAATNWSVYADRITAYEG